MNRIAGILNFNQVPVDPLEIHRMLAAMEFYGERQQSIWFEGQVGLGCAQRQDAPRKRSVTEPYREGRTIVFDGRLDNRAELLAVLQPPLRNGRSPLGAEDLVLAAYEKWGLDCPAHLIGDFAFAIWDASLHRLLCARDHFGVKPLYYSFSHDAFVFASTPQAILACGKVASDLYEERIADFLVNPLEGVDKTSSFYKDVFRLPPAHLLVVQDGNLAMQRYWELGPQTPMGLQSDEDYVEAFRDLFTEAVRCRLQDLPLPASMLSGGMDSSAIVGVGSRILAEEGKRLHALSIISSCRNPNRESAHILAVCHGRPLQAHVISQIELSDWVDDLVQSIETEAEPFDCLMNLNRALYFHAQEHGMSALLDGIDGDVLLSGSGHLTQLWRQGALRTLLKETLQADGLTAEYKAGRQDFRDSFLSAVTPLAPEWVRRLRQPARNRRQLQSAIHETIIEPGFAERSRVGERLAMLASHSPRSFRQVDAHRTALDHPFLTVGLERYERVASSFGVEARHPFTDVRLAEFCLALPWHLKTQGGWTKMILRRALESDLPQQVVWRKDKDSLMWEVNRCLLKERAEPFYQLTCDAQEQLQAYVDTRKLTTFWDEYLILGDETHAESLWAGVALAMWLRNGTKIMATRLDHAEAR